MSSKADEKNIKFIANAVGKYLADRKQPVPEKFTFAISGYINEQGFICFTEEHIINQVPFNQFIHALVKLDGPVGTMQ